MASKQNNTSADRRPTRSALHCTKSAMGAAEERLGGGPIGPGAPSSGSYMAAQRLNSLARTRGRRDSIR